MKNQKKLGSTIIRSLCLAAVFPFLIFAADLKSSGALPQQSLSYRDAVGKTLDIAGVKSGMIIGELGAGYGFFTKDLAERVGKNGRIYANDIEQEFLDSLDKKDLPNVKTVLGETDDPLFPVKDLDMVIMRSVFHDLENPLAMLENLKVYMKPNAFLVIVGPRPAERNRTSPLPIHKMTKEELLYIINQSSFVLESETLLPSWWGIYVFKVAKHKEKDVWPNWLDKFRSAVEETKEFERESKVSPVKKRIAWERILNSYRDNNPRSIKDEELRDFIQERIAFLNKTAERSALYAKDTESRIFQTNGSAPDYSLRSDYGSIGMDDIEKTFQRLGFKVKGKWRAISGDFPNRFEAKEHNGESVVVDRATGLVWHQGGSTEILDYYEAMEWIDELNIQNYAGYSDWRLPTIEEAASLMETQEMNGDLLIDPLFSKVQRVIWTGDDYYGGRSWLAMFYRSSFSDDLKVHMGWVRPVR